MALIIGVYLKFFLSEPFFSWLGLKQPIQYTFLQEEIYYGKQGNAGVT